MTASLDDEEWSASRSAREKFNGDGCDHQRAPET